MCDTKTMNVAWSLYYFLAQSAWSLEYTDCVSAKGLES